jgi:ABC-type spermidine/putrescine transport system permease subunit II
MKWRRVGLLAIPPVGYLLLFFVIPVGLIIYESFFTPAFSLEKYGELVSNPVYGRALGNTLSISAAVTLITLVLGIPILIVLERLSGAWRIVVLVSLLLPYAAGGELLRILAWKVFLSPAGPISVLLQALHVVQEPVAIAPGRLAIFIALTHVTLPYFVVTAFATTRGVDRRLMRAGVVMGATRIQAFLSILLPLMLPGFIAAGLLTFIICVGSFSTPSALGAPGDVVLPILVTYEIQRSVDWGQAAAVGVVLLLMAGFSFALMGAVGGAQAIYGGSLSRRRSGSRQSTAASRLWVEVVLSRLVGRSLRSIEGRRSAARVGTGFVYVVTGLLVIYMLVPLLVAMPSSLTTSTILTFPPRLASLRWYAEFLGDAQWTSATLTSLGVGLATAIVASLIGLSAALALVRGPTRGRTALLGLVLTPLVMPWIVTALGLYFESVDLGIAYSFLGIVVGHVVLAIPFAAVILTAALAEFNWDLDRAAQALGASIFQRSRDVLWPYLRAAVLSSLVFAFVTSFTEVVYAFLMSSVNIHTLPVSMWEGIIYNVTPTVAAAGGVLVIVSVAVLGGGLLLQRTLRRSPS